MDINLIKEIRTAITTVYKDKFIVGEMCFAQAVHESNLLGTPSKLALFYKNLFGIKGVGTRGSILLMTWEHINGKDIRVKQPFAFNNSYEDSIHQHRRLMSKLRYAKVLESDSLEDACYTVYKCGYATDPNYPAKLLERHKEAMRLLS